MNPVIPLLFALLLVNRKKLQHDNGYRISTLSVVGFTCFFLLKFVADYFTFFPDRSAYQNYVYCGAILACIGLCLSPWFCKTNYIKTAVFFTGFVLSVIVMFTCSKSIETYIALAGAYFDGDKDALSSTARPLNVKPYLIKKGAYTLLLSDSWERKFLDESGFFEYFDLYVNEKKVVELRPNCFHKSKLSIPKIVSSVVAQDGMNKILSTRNCYSRPDGLACLLKSGGGSKERWRWWYQRGRQGIALDALFYDDGPDLRVQVANIINTLKVEDLPVPPPTCMTTIKWF